MLRYSISFFFTSIIAAVLGFGGIAGGAASIAKIISYIFLTMFVLSMVIGAIMLKKNEH